MIFFSHLPPTSSHLHPLQVENYNSNSRLVVDEDDNGKFRPEKVNPYPAVDNYCHFYPVLLVDQITVSENEMCVQTSRFANI